MVLVNMERYNVIVIDEGTGMSKRNVILRELAVKQMKTMQSLNLENLPNNFSPERINESEN